MSTSCPACKRSLPLASGAMCMCQWDDRSESELKIEKLEKKIATLEETIRHEGMRNRAYNEQFLKDKDEKEKLTARVLLLVDVLRVAAERDLEAYHDKMRMVTAIEGFKEGY